MLDFSAFHLHTKRLLTLSSNNVQRSLQILTKLRVVHEFSKDTILKGKFKMGSLPCDGCNW